MKFDYFNETDSLYITLAEGKSIESQEVKNGIVLDFDHNGNLVGIDIDQVSKVTDIKKLDIASLPLSEFTYHGIKQKLA